MEVRLTSSFDERIKAMDPEEAYACDQPRPMLLVSTLGAVVSLQHHFEKHGNGRTRRQYTFDALRFFEKHKDQATWGRWNPRWPEAFRVKIGDQGGYFTPGGRVLSYWDAYESSSQTAV
jgi:hypothetical protein